MILVLDSNEYINHCSKTNSLEVIFSNEDVTILINDLIIREVIRNLNEKQAKDFYNLIFNKNIEFYGQKLPLALLARCKKAGLKKGDIEIAAFCKHIKADYLVTENRHFLKDIKIDKLKVLSLQEFVKKMQ